MITRSALPILLLASASVAQTAEHVDLIGCDHCAQTKQCMSLPRTRALREAADQDASRAVNTSTTDLTHYDLDLTINLTGSTISGSNTLSLTSLTDGLTVMPLQLSSNFTISSVLVNGVTRTFTRVDSINFNVNLGQTFNTGQAFTVKVNYSGTPSSGGSFGSITFRTRSGAREAYTLSEPDFAYTWFPCKNLNTDKCDADLKFTVPNGNTVASNGILQGTTAVGGTQTQWYYKTTYPTANYLYFFSVTNFNTYTNTWNFTPSGGSPIAMPLKFFIYPENDSAANRNVWFNCSNMLSAYSLDTRFGVYPFASEKYGIYQFGFGGGMEHQTFTGQGVFDESVTAHELGHQWWGDMVTCADWHHIWCNEGFATYTEALWSEWKPGSSGLGALYAAMAARRPSSVNGTVWCPSLTDQNRIFSSDFSYRKGGWVLHMLRKVMGDAAFFQGLRNHRQNLTYGAVTTEDFQAACEAAYGASLNWFFQEWVYQPGAPAYQNASRIITVNGQMYAEVYLAQVQSASYPTYQMPIELSMQPQNAPGIFFNVQNSARTQWYLVPVPAPLVSGIGFDNNKWILWTSSTSTSFVEGPPKVIATAPAAGSSTQSNVFTGASVTFHKAVTAAANQFTLTGPAPSNAAVPFTFNYDAPTQTATLTPTAALAPGDYSLTALDTITATAGAQRLDGETTSLTNPAALPSGDGIAQGNFAFQFTITAPPSCVGDLNADNQVNTADLTILLAAFGTSVPPGTSGDLNADGQVNTADLTIMLGAFGVPCT